MEKAVRLESLTYAGGVYRPGKFSAMAEKEKKRRVGHTILSLPAGAR
jgi:hypothetical protein